jgi:hypothetical protein
MQHKKLVMYASRERVVSLAAFGPAITAGRSTSSSSTCCYTLPQ